MKKLMSILCICAVFMSQAAYAGGIEFSQNYSDFKINAVTGEGKLDKSDKVAVFILKEGQSFENGITAENVFYANAAKNLANEDAHFTFDFSDEDMGVYPVRVAVTKSNGAVEFYDYEYINMSSALVAEALADFDTATAENFEDIFYKYTETNIVLSKINSAMPKSTENFGGSFAIGRDILKASENANIKIDMSEIDDIYEAMKMGQFVYAFMNGSASDAEAAVEAYKAYIADFYDFDATTKNVYTVFKNITDENMTAEEFVEGMKTACKLSYLQDSSNEEAAKYMEEHAEELGIDLDYLNDNNIKMIDIARYIDKSDAVKYKDGMGDYVKKIADDLIAKNKENSTSKPSNNKHSGGGSSGGGGGSATFSPSLVTPGNIQTGISKPEAEKPLYNDITGFEWAKDGIKDLTDKNIINGVGNGNFEPGRYVYREEFAKMVASAFGLQGGDSKERFADSKLGDWHYAYVTAAANAGIVNGIGGDLFGVGNVISRQDAAVICYRIMVNKNKLTEFGMDLPFSDKDEIAEYAKEAVTALRTANVISGFDDGTFRPNNGITRAEAAVIISRLISFFE